jgi:hypothetical protein
LIPGFAVSRAHTDFSGRGATSATQDWFMSHAENDERASAILGRKASGLLAHDEALIELADADCVAAIAGLIAERVSLRAEVLLRALEAQSDEEISVICRAAGLKLDSFSALLRMRRRCNLGTESAPAQALSLFSQLSRPAAEKRLAAMAPEASRTGLGRRKSLNRMR